MKLLMKTLVGWLEKRMDIDQAFLTLRDGSLAFVVVRNKSHYDADFEDCLSELDIQISEDVDLNLIELDVIALPEVSRNGLRSFLHPEVSFTFVHS